MERVELHCYMCVFQPSRWDHSENYIYVFAESFEEAAQIFNKKKRWQWNLREVRHLGRGWDKDSPKEE